MPVLPVLWPCVEGRVTCRPCRTRSVQTLHAAVRCVPRWLLLSDASPSLCQANTTTRQVASAFSINENENFHERKCLVFVNENENEDKAITKLKP